jgi:malate synthase
MEDLATARISVAQMAQRILHKARDTETGEVHDLALVKGLLLEEVDDILTQLSDTVDRGNAKAVQAYDEAEVRYRKAVKISMLWTKNYTELNFRSLGSYTREDLDEIGTAPDAI